MQAGAGLLLTGYQCGHISLQGHQGIEMVTPRVKQSFQEKAQKEHTVSKTDKYKTHQASYRNVYSQLRGRTD